MPYAPPVTIEEAFVAYTKANTDLASLIGARLYPDKASQKATAPYVTYEFQSGDETPYMGGEANDLHGDVFLLRAIGSERVAAAQIRDLLVAMFAGTAARGLWQPGLFVSGCITRMTSGETDEPRDASERHDRQTAVSVLIRWGRR